MQVVADAVHAEDLPREVKSGNLLPTVVRGLVGLHGPGADRVNGFEHVALAVQVLALLQGLAALDYLVQLLNIVAFQCQGQADAVQTAIAAVYLIVVNAGLKDVLLTRIRKPDGHTKASVTESAQYNRKFRSPVARFSPTASPLRWWQRSGAAAGRRRGR